MSGIKRSRSRLGGRTRLSAPALRSKIPLSDFSYSKTKSNECPGPWNLCSRSRRIRSSLSSLVTQEFRATPIGVRPCLKLRHQNQQRSTYIEAGTQRLRCQPRNSLNFLSCLSLSSSVLSSPRDYFTLHLLVSLTVP